MAMTKKDFEVVAAALADVEAIVESLPDPVGIAASTLRIAADTIGGRLKQQYPRFDTGKFQKAALPIQSERMKQAILKSIAQSEG